jgi:hypothetical protein
MEPVTLSTAAWNITGYMARNFLDRLLGVWGAPAGSAVVLQTSSIHGFGLRRPLAVIGLDEAMRVVGLGTLRPNRIMTISTARYLVELPLGRQLPGIGDRIEIIHV